MAEEGSSEPPKFRLDTTIDPVRHKLWQAQQQRDFTDFHIEVNGVRVACHKVVLSIQSDYFNRMLQHENTKEVLHGAVDIQGLDVDAVKLVIDFMYSGSIEFEFHMTQEVIKVTDRFQLTDNILQEKISEYVISHLCPDNCLGWFKFGEQMNLKSITTSAQSIMMEKVNEVCSSSEFENLSFEDTTEYVQKVLECHSYHDQCLQAFVMWVMSDVTQRSPMFERILTIIDLNKCSVSLLKDIYKQHGKVLLHSLDLLHQFTTAALPRGITESGVSTFDVIVAGGCVRRSVYNRKTWLLNLESGWCVEKASAIKDQCYAAICASPDGLICAGGSPTGFVIDATAECILYHKDTNRWIKLPLFKFQRLVLEQHVCRKHCLWC